MPVGLLAERKGWDGEKIMQIFWRWKQGALRLRQMIAAELGMRWGDLFGYKISPQILKIVYFIFGSYYNFIILVPFLPSKPPIYSLCSF